MSYSMLTFGFARDAAQGAAAQVVAIYDKPPQRGDAPGQTQTLRAAAWPGRLLRCGSFIWLAKLHSPRLAAGPAKRLREHGIAHNKLKD